MAREAPVRHASSFEEYLEFESQSQERHEFVDGNLFVMPGGTPRHNRIAVNVVKRLDDAALARGCLVFANDVIVKTPDEVGYYPDVYVVCDPQQRSERIQRHPCIIIEVLSSSTEVIDRGEKLRNYRTIPSLEQYVLLEQNEVLAEVYSKQPDGSWRHDVLRAGSSIRFSGLGLDVPLGVLYENLPDAN